jgi:ribulose-bisphosphate carboxylase large chain
MKMTKEGIQMSDERVFATYLIETPYPVEKAAEIMAGEQSTGTFIAVPGETTEIKRQHRANVVKIEELDSSITPGLPECHLSKGMEKPVYKRARVTLSFPLHNFGHSLPNLLSTVAGNLYELREFSGLRLEDLELPESFSKKYQGPKYGIEGTREFAGVYKRPIIGTIIKPSIGLPGSGYGPLVRELAEAGIDFIKDDELCGNPPYLPFEERVRIVMDEINRASEKTGKKVMYAFNITGEIDEMKRNHDTVVKAGGTCVMVSINSVGYSAVTHLNGYSEVPIHGHRNQWGAMTRSPFLGMGFLAYQKICRLAGVDHLHTNGLNSKFAESNESVVTSIRSLLTPMFGGYEAMPVLSSAQWAGSAITTYQQVRSLDVIHLAGGGILAHPGGAKEGVKSMQLGWEAAEKGHDLEVYANKHHELKKAIEAFGKK